MYTRNKRSVIQYLRRNKAMSIIAGHAIVIAALGLIMLGSTFGSTLFRAFAQAPCASTDQTYVVAGGDTLGAIASRYGTTWQSLSSHNQLANPNMIYIGQRLCIPNRTTAITFNVALQSAQAIRGMGNFFPYGQCTWWADQRYYQLHGVYVPWTTGANAWQWTARAEDFHWHVASSPSVGAIIDLQPGVQGASALGHVAVVESVLSNGNVIASNMNWGASPWQITNVQFSPGPGVTFITI